jgi:hypothetical protein
MKKTLTAMALAAGVGTQLFAQLNKEDTITFALTTYSQTSVSTTTAVDVGNWSDLPTHYKTGTKKITQTQILQAIGYVLHGNANWYSSKASLVLVQGELSGFLAMDLDLAETYATHNDDDVPELDGYFDWHWSMYDNRTDLPNATDTLFAQLPNGRHFGQVPDVWYDYKNLQTSKDTPPDFVGKFPTGHQQPWGQIFVKDPANPRAQSTADSPYCENVTFFFAITVQECYDCFYLNSFISDATFTFKGTASPVPCCGGTEVMLGKGVDKYYMTLSFDNTINNPYLDYYLTEYVTDHFPVADNLYVDPNSTTVNSGDVDGIMPGLNSPYPEVIWFEGVYPDALPYFDPIKSGAVANAEPYLMRFTLNGIMTYSWTLGFINKSDLNPDFYGAGNYVCDGYGYIALSCALIDGSVKFTEKLVKTACCNDDDSWYDNWYGIGYYPIEHVDNERDQSVVTTVTMDGYPDSEWSNLWMDGVGYYQPDAPGYYDVSEDLSAGYAGITPFNTEASLSYHANFDESYEPWTTKGFIDWLRYVLHGDNWY